MKDLRKRWDDRQIAMVLDRLRANKSLEDLEFVGRHNDRWDLRYFRILSSVGESVVQFGKVELAKIDKLASFTRCTFADIDFSYADLSLLQGTHCEFRNVVFEKARLNDVRFWACKFSDVNFEKASLRGASLGGNMGVEACEYLDVDWSGADLRNTGHGFEIYSRCQFESTKLKGVNFEGARFSDCVFSGLLDSVQFRKHAHYNWIEGTPPDYQKRFVNEMKNIDFSHACLRGVDFDSVDLGTCRFPNDGEHLVLNKQLEVFLAVQAEISREWIPEERNPALLILEGMYINESNVNGGFLTPGKKRMPIKVVNLSDFRHWIGPSVGEKVFTTLREHNDRINKRGTLQMKENS